MKAYERLLKYVVVRTPSDENSETVPSSACQFDLAKLLEAEMKELGLTDLGMFLYKALCGYRFSGRQCKLCTYDLADTGRRGIAGKISRDGSEQSLFQYTIAKRCLSPAGAGREKSSDGSRTGRLCAG